MEDEFHHCKIEALLRIETCNGFFGRQLVSFLFAVIPYKKSQICKADGYVLSGDLGSTVDFIVLSQTSRLVVYVRASVMAMNFERVQPRLT